MREELRLFDSSKKFWWISEIHILNYKQNVCLMFKIETLNFIFLNFLKNFKNINFLFFHRKKKKKLEYAKQFRGYI